MAYNPQNTNGQATSANSAPVALSTEQVQDLIVTGQAGQSAVGQNIILATAGTGSFDTLNPSTGVSYRSYYCQIICSALITGGITFEGSNDNVTFGAMVMTNDVTLTGTTATTITITSGSYYFSGKTAYRYIRARISTAISGGTIQAITKFSAESYVPRITTIGVVQSSVSTINSNLVAAVIADQASAVIITTTTSAAIAQSNGLSYGIIIPITLVSGTNPTMDIDIQESDDTGVNWFTVYSFPRATTATTLRTPKLPNSGNRLRYVVTIGGTTPSFTRSISRLYYQDASPVFRQLIDRSVVLTTLNAVTPSLLVSSTKNVQLVANIGTTTIAPILQLEGSDDNGLTWYAIGTTLTTVASSTVQLTVNNISTTLLRARVQTAGTATVMGSITIKGF